jgi:hypothetical protein
MGASSSEEDPMDRFLDGLIRRGEGDGEHVRARSPSPDVMSRKVRLRRRDAFREPRQGRVAPRCHEYAKLLRVTLTRLAPALWIGSPARPVRRSHLATRRARRVVPACSSAT